MSHNLRKKGNFKGTWDVMSFIPFDIINDVKLYGRSSKI